VTADPPTSEICGKKTILIAKVSEFNAPATIPVMRLKSFGSIQGHDTLQFALRLSFRFGEPEYREIRGS
jgi:hypothetical protein